MTRASALFLPALLLLATAVAPRPGAAAGDDATPSRSRLVLNAYREAMAARDAGRWHDYRAAADRALALEPGHPVLLIHLARASLATGDREAAGRCLLELAATGAQHDLAADTTFAALREAPAYAAAVAEMAAHARPQGAAEVVARIAVPDFLPEGIAHDPVTGDLFVGSIRQRRIVRVDPQGNVTDFAPTRREDLWSVVGMKVDAARRLLWACSAAGAAMEGGSAADTSRTALCGFDLETGRLVAQAMLPDTSRAHALNDCTLGPDGSVYASDAAGGVWVLRPGAGALAPLLSDDTLAGPNGLTVTPDGRTLYVSEYALGIAAVDLATLAVERVQAPPALCAVYVDGLDWQKRSLVAVQNGRGLDRVARFFLDETGRRVVGMTVLASRLPEFDEPTTGVPVGDGYLFIANSELHRIGRDGAVEPADPPRPFLVMRTALQ